jgi:hypothetical protein
VMSFQASNAAGLVISALRRSPGSLCTTPPGNRGLLTGPRYSASCPLGTRTDVVVARVGLPLETLARESERRPFAEPRGTARKPEDEG